MTTKPLVESFRDAADIQRHMLRPEHHGGRAVYGLNTHDFVFSPVAERQFWEWHAEREIENRRAALAEAEARQDAFNRKIAERKLALELARPFIEIIGTPVLRSPSDGALRVRCSRGGGPGPIRYYWIGFRETWRRGAADGGWTKWRTDFRPWNLPYEDTVYGLDPFREYDVAVIGGHKYGSVESIPVRVVWPGEAIQDAGGGRGGSGPAEAMSVEGTAEPAPAAGWEHHFSGVWGNAWGGSRASRRGGATARSRMPGSCCRAASEGSSRRFSCSMGGRSA